MAASSEVGVEDPEKGRAEGGRQVHRLAYGEPLPVSPGAKGGFSSKSTLSTGSSGAGSRGRGAASTRGGGWSGMVPASVRGGWKGSELAAAVSYCTASGSMVLLNKCALSGFRFKSPLALLLFQNAMTVVMVVAYTHALGLKLEPMRWKAAKVWLPVNVLFVAMLGSNFYALTALGVATATVLKQCTNLITIVGDYFMFRKRYSAGVWIALSLVILSAVCAGATDLEFTARGYAWQGLNCALTAAYSLGLKGVMGRMVKVTTTSKGLDEHSMVYYNNLLSLPLLCVAVIISGEHRTLLLQPDLHRLKFQLTALSSAFLGFAVSFSSLWFMSKTTATNFGLVGSLNKIPVAVLGILMFPARTNWQNLVSIGIGLAAGILFVWTKAKGGSVQTVGALPQKEEVEPLKSGTGR